MHRDRREREKERKNKKERVFPPHPQRPGSVLAFEETLQQLST